MRGSLFLRPRDAGLRSCEKFLSYLLLLILLYFPPPRGSRLGFPALFFARFARLFCLAVWLAEKFEEENLYDCAETLLFNYHIGLLPVNVPDLAEWEYGNINRHDPLLVELVKTLGEKAGVEGTKLFVQEVYSSSNRYVISLNFEGAETAWLPERLNWSTARPGVYRLYSY